MRRGSSLTVGLAVVLCLSILIVGGAGGAVAQSTTNFTVAPDGSGDYTSIQNAIDNATDGDRIEVSPGTYEEHAEIAKNITLHAPGGATVANTSTVAAEYTRFEARSGFQIYGDATPTISGFTFTDWRWGISAGASEGDWTVKNVDIDGGTCGVCAAGTPGDWIVKNATIDVAFEETSISGFDSSGSWRVENSTLGGGHLSASGSSGDVVIRNTTFADAVDGASFDEATGNWSVRSSVFRNLSADGIKAEKATAGQWTIQNTTMQNIGENGITVDESSTSGSVQSVVIRNTGERGVDAPQSEGRITMRDTVVTTSGMDGIFAENTSGDWTLENVTVRESEDMGVEADESSGEWTVRDTLVTGSGDDGIHAEDTSGSWTIENDTVEDTGGDAVDISRADGQWTVRHSVLRNVTGAGVAADDAIAGNASHNYWGAADGPSGAFNGSGAVAFGNLTVRPYYTDSSLTTLSSATGSVDDEAPPAVVGDTPPKNLPASEGGFDDTVYEDVNGDGAFDIVDVQAFFQNGNYESDAVQNNPQAFNYDGEGGVDIFDVQALFQHVTS